MAAEAAQARPETPAALVSVHHAVRATHAWQAKLGERPARYYWVADRHSTPTWQRWRIAGNWWLKAAAAHTRWVERPKHSYPSWFASSMSCISDHEEYGYSGGTTVAGYFGFVFSPSTYQSPGPSIAATYGDSWLNVPLGPQLEMAWSLYSTFGWSPWTTASGCGLA